MAGICNLHDLRDEGVSLPKLIEAAELGWSRHIYAKNRDLTREEALALAGAMERLAATLRRAAKSMREKTT